MCKFSANVAFDKATNGQTDIKHELRSHFVFYAYKGMTSAFGTQSESALNNKHTHIKHVLHFSLVLHRA